MWEEKHQNFQGDVINPSFWIHDLDKLDSDLCSNITWLSTVNLDAWSWGLEDNKNNRDLMAVPPYEICMHFLFRKRHRTYNIWKKKYVNIKIIAEITYDNVVDTDFAQTLDFKFTVLPHGSVTYKYTGKVFYPRINEIIGPAGMFAPFDLITWLCIVASGICSTLVMKFLIQLTHLDQYLGTRILFFHICLFLNQTGDSSVRRLFRPFWSFAPYIAMTYFITLFLNNLYGGELYSSLSITPNPNNIHDMNELIAAGIPLLSTAEDGHELEIELRVRAGWHNGTENAAKAILNHVIYPKFETFNSSTIFITGIINNSPVELKNGTNFTVPPVFAIIGREPTVKYYTRIIKELTKKLDFDFDLGLEIVAKKFVHITRNFAAPILSKTISYLDQSGLLNYWKKNTDKYENIARFRGLVKDKDFIRNYEIPIDVINANYRFIHTPDVKEKPKLVEFSPVKLWSLCYPLLGCVGFVLLACILFIWELRGEELRQIRVRRRLKKLARKAARAEAKEGKNDIEMKEFYRNKAPQTETMRIQETRFINVKPAEKVEQQEGDDMSEKVKEARWDDFELILSIDEGFDENVLSWLADQFQLMRREDPERAEGLLEGYQRVVMQGEAERRERKEVDGTEETEETMVIDWRQKSESSRELSSPKAGLSSGVEYPVMDMAWDMASSSESE